ncbi:class I SAM-dependent methyltransferase [Microgenomates group bacterium]|nr:class I SAM-dependent methyltransferase [Microgenomates group bacterium]
MTNYITLNNHFYQQIAPHFAKTRNSSWSGWETWWQSVSSLLPDNPTVLDLACGNLRLKKFLDKKLKTYSYLGVDSCLELLQLSNEDSRFFQHLDLLTPLAKNKSFVPEIKQPANDLICCFGFLHHLLDKKLQLSFLKETLKLLDDHGFLVLTFWQPLQDKNLAQRAKHLRDNNYLLDWRAGTTAVRYCHNFTPETIAQLLSELPVKVVLSYQADGSTHNLNHYLILQKLLD